MSAEMAAVREFFDALMAGIDVVEERDPAVARELLGRMSRALYDQAPAIRRTTVGGPIDAPPDAVTTLKDGSTLSIWHVRGEQL